MAYPITDIRGISADIAASAEVGRHSHDHWSVARGRNAEAAPANRRKDRHRHEDVLEWVTTADRMRVKGVGFEYAELLRAAGVRTVSDLQFRNAQNLFKKMSEANKGKLVRLLPKEKTVERWIENAKKLQPHYSLLITGKFCRPAPPRCDTCALDSPLATAQRQTKSRCRGRSEMAEGTATKLIHHAFSPSPDPARGCWRGCWRRRSRRHGRTQRHARTPSPTVGVTSTLQPRSRTPSAWPRKAPTFSTSARNRPGPMAARYRFALDEERQRLDPVLPGVVALGIPVSIDTIKATVAAWALEAGAAIVNDVWGLQRDPDMARVVAEHDAPVIIMHNRESADPAIDIVADVTEFFSRSLEIAWRAGIRHDRIVLDPGIGFGKTSEQSLICIARLHTFRSFGLPLLVGASRKRFINSIVPSEPMERLGGSLAAHLMAVENGAAIVRVHDVAPTVQALAVAAAIRHAR